MLEINNELKSAIHNAAKQEIRRKGFDFSSMSNIAQGACISYEELKSMYSSKEELMEEMIGECYNTCLNKVADIHNYYLIVSCENKVINKNSKLYKMIIDFVNYIYDNFDDVFLFLNYGESSKFGQIIDDIEELEYQLTTEYQKRMKSIGDMSYLYPVNHKMTACGLICFVLDMLRRRSKREFVIDSVYMLMRFHSIGVITYRI